MVAQAAAVFGDSLALVHDMSWEMRKGDSLSGMKAMDSSSIDVVISDPPYDEKTHANVMTNKKGTDGTIQLGFEALSTMSHIGEMLRVAKRWVLCFCALEQFGEYKLFSGDAWVRAGLWVRTNSMPQKTGDRPGQGAEGLAIMWAGNGRPSWNGGGMPGVWRGPRSSGEHHPTEKPEWLMETLVRQFTDYGETVLDTHAGSGTTGVACVRLGRNFIGYEMLDKHYQTAIVRLTGTKEQMDLPYRPKKKPKQIKLIGGKENEDKEDGKVDGQGQDVPDHHPWAERDEAETSGHVESGDKERGSAGEHGGSGVPTDLGGETPDRDREEGDPLDGQPEGDQAEPDENAGW